MDYKIGLVFSLSQPHQRYIYVVKPTTVWRYECNSWKKRTWDLLCKSFIFFCVHFCGNRTRNR